MLCTKPNDVFKFVKFMRKEGRNIKGGGCIKDKDGRLVVREISWEITEGANGNDHECGKWIKSDDKCRYG